MHIHIVSNWGMFPILRQTLDSDLASHLITYGESTIDCDVLVVLDDLAAHSPIQAVSSKACILFLLETPSVYRPNRRFIRQFEEIHTYRKDINSRRVKQITACAPWHIGVSRRLVDGKMILDSQMKINEIKNLKPFCKIDRISVFSTEKRITQLHAMRAEFERLLLTNNIDLKIDVFGGSGKWVPDKLEGLLPYKYSIAVENSIHEGYFSEKLTDALLSGCYVFYHGCPTVHDIFPGALTSIDISSPLAAIKVIQDAVRLNKYKESASSRNRARKYILHNLNLMSKIVKASDQIVGIAERHPRDHLLRSSHECRLRRMLQRYVK